MEEIVMDPAQIDYSALDRPEILMFLFHPRPEWRGIDGDEDGVEDLLIPVEKGIQLGARFYGQDPAAPTILFFHGNGEIVDDYHELGPIYTGMGINFLPVDYRGYGRSTGQPTITAMMRDGHAVFAYVRRWLRDKGPSGPFLVMGRSLGSACALELACHYQADIQGLIVESGFAYAGPLLRLLGVDLDAIAFSEEKGFRNVDKVRDFLRPTLIIHAELDHIIPFSDGQALYEACPAQEKTLLKIPGANHNDIFMKGLSAYLQAVKDLMEKIKDF